MTTIDTSSTRAGRKAWADSLESGITRLFVWGITRAWQATSEGAQSIIARVGAHLVVVGLAALAVTLSGVQLPPKERASAEAFLPAPSIELGSQVAGLPFATRGGPRLVADETQVVRMAAPLTPHIYRPRKGVISYTVQAGDTMFGIAQQFNLQPESILWANSELKDNPDLLSVGMSIAVPPVDGILHTIQKGDTLDSVAKKYKVTPQAILAAEWNNLTPGAELPVSQTLMVPGGKREMVVWQLPSTTKAATGTGAFGWTNAGQCLGVTSKPLGAGQLTWPTGSHWVSGNPYAWWHRGIDLSGKLGDPVYAADAGTVMWAGPNSWGYGNLVVLDHGNGWVTLYAHLSQVYVRCGQQILQGATVGAVGSTGRSTGPHLHFETRLNGDLPNPLNYLPKP